MLQAGITEDEENALSAEEETENDCLTPWDVQSRRIYEDDGVWPSLYGGEGGGHGYVQTDSQPVAFACNQRDEVRDLHDLAGALGAQPGMKQQTFVAEPVLCVNDQGGNRMDITEDVTTTLRASMGGHQPLVIPINTQVALRADKPGDGTGFGVGEDGDPAFTLQEAHSHGVFTSQCLNAWDTQQSRIFTPDSTAPTLTGADGGGGRNPAGLVFAAAFCAGASSTAGNIGYQTECSPTLKASESGTNMVPTVLCLNDQGGSQMHCTEDVTGTLRAQEHGHQPLIMASQQGGAPIGIGVCPTITSAAGTSGNNQPVLFENHGIDSRYTGPHEVAPTMSARMGTGGNNVPLTITPCVYSLDGVESNSMKSSNPFSGCHQTDIARTIDTGNPCPSKNQGGIAIVQPTYCIAGNIIDREVQNGGNGLGCQEDVAYTLTGADRHAVYSRQRSDEFADNEVASTQSARQHKDATDLICQPYQDTVGTIGFSDHKGVNNQFVSEDKCIVEAPSLIRRLTPLECERLQGFPDGWTDIPKASDSARYKALGNSVAIPCVDFVLRGIAYFLVQEESECTSTPTI